MANLTVTPGCRPTAPSTRVQLLRWASCTRQAHGSEYITFIGIGLTASTLKLGILQSGVAAAGAIS